jgi:hypothetical protein
MLKKLLFLFIAGISVFVAEAQNVLPIGKWRAHLPIQVGKHVTQSQDKVYFSNDFAVISLDKEELSSDFLTRIDGLSNVGVGFIRYNQESNILIIIYDNAAIDLVSDDGDIITLNQIKNFDNFAGEKVINELYIENDSIVYLAASYGVSKLNLFAQEFVFTTFTGVPVEDVQIYNEQIYAATSEGIYVTAVDNINPDDFGNWDLQGVNEGFPEDYSATAFEDFDGALHVAINDTLYRYENNELIFKYFEPLSTIEFLSHEGVHLLAGFRPNKLVYFHPDGTTDGLPFNCAKVPNYAVEDEQGRIWFGNEEVRSSFRFLPSVGVGFCETINFNSPWSEASWDIAIKDGALWLASGSLDQTLSARFLSDGFASFINGQWTIYNRGNRDELKGADKDPAATDDDVQVFVATAIHPGNGTVYMGSFIEGLIEIQGEEINHYIETNSTLQRATGDPRVRVAGLAFDEDNNLWISNNSVPEPLSVLLPDGTFKSFEMPTCNENEVYELAVDGSGYKWMMLGNNSAGLLLFDEGEMDDPADDQCRVFTSNNSELPTNNVNCVTKDLEGDIWVGTTEGIVIFECGGSAFAPECQGTRRIVEQDGFGAFLLETENVKTIAVDGANRKWVGTENGVFVLSANGEEQEARFTTTNSPLFSDDIIEIEVDQRSGEVFIGTLNGLLSYQSDAVVGGRVHNANITVYPNPIREDYDGPIAIKGLARDANVKITDVSGKLVFETTALGGQAIWDGRDYNGRRVNTGVYLVFSSSNARFSGFSGEADSAVAKILVVN